MSASLTLNVHMHVLTHSIPPLRPARTIDRSSVSQENVTLPTEQARHAFLAWLLIKPYHIIQPDRQLFVKHFLAVSVV